MSYILDALRKSDKQRQRGTAPTLLSAQATVAAPRQPAFLWYVLLGGALVMAGIVIGWLRPWQQEQQAAPASAPVTAAKPPESGARQSMPAPLPASPDAASMPEREPPTQKSASPATPARVPASAVIKQDLPSPALAVKRREPTAVAAVPKAAATPSPQMSAGAGTAQEQSVMTMAELPVQIQQDIPRMSITVHAYSSQPKNRLVYINDRLVLEGMTVAPGLTLEQITPDGMIFTYKGYRFSRRVQGSGISAETR